MRIVRINYQHFRGFETLTLHPARHAVLLGPPRSGRSDIIEGLSRVLDPESIRRRIGEEFDFHGCDKSLSAEVEVVISDLGNEVEEDFLNRLEVWRYSTNELLTDASSPASIDVSDCAWAIRLTYHLEWIEEEDRPDEFVFWPKTSIAPEGDFTRATAAEIARLQFRRIRVFTGRFLDLADRGRFRQLIESSQGTDFGAAVDAYVTAIQGSARDFTASEQLRDAAARTFDLVAGPLGIETNNIGDILSFAPEGGAASGLLRSLRPTLDLGDGAGMLPAHRHGSSVAALIRLAESLGVVAPSIVAIDDLGDGLDSGSALHVAALLQKSAAQAWITTRNPTLAEVFDADDVFRIGRSPDGDCVIRQGRRARDKGERIAAKHWMRNVLPALSFNSIVILEGPDDLATLHTMSLRLYRERGVALPATSRITFVSAAAAGSGGATSVPRVAQLAKEMGLWTIAVIDWDKDDADTILEKAKEASDTVIRLPESFAIERLIVSDIDPTVLADTINVLVSASGFQLSKDYREMSHAELKETGIALLKSSGGLHSAFLELLPPDSLPSGILQLQQMISAAAQERTPGHLQM